MDSGLYAAYTGLLARTQALDTVANNLANANTSGFRAQREVFRGVMAGLASEQDDSAPLTASVNQYGILGSTMLDLSQGQLTETGNPLDVGIEGDGLFAVTTATGTRYTRNGQFQRDPQGFLTDSQGDKVQNTAGSPIQLLAGEVTIAGDGTLSVQTAEGSSVVGQIGLFHASASDLQSDGNNLFLLTAGVKPTAATGQMEQGKVECANQDAVHSTMQLMLVERQAEMMQRAMSTFLNDFDRTAGEELGKVQA